MAARVAISQPEVLGMWVALSERKAAMSVPLTFLLGIQAGALLSFGVFMAIQVCRSPARTPLQIVATCAILLSDTGPASVQAGGGMTAPQYVTGNGGAITTMNYVPLAAVNPGLSRFLFAVIGGRIE